MPICRTSSLNSYVTLRSVLVFASLFAAFSAFAQEEARLDKIEIRGTKERKTQEESVESVSIVRPNPLAEAGSGESLQFLEGTPNVQINRAGESFSIRGINNTGVTGFQKDNLASLVVDDVFQTDLAAIAGGFDLWDMERVEILRGAQSTSQGVNSLAGTILLYHEVPDPEFGGRFSLGYGSYNRTELGLISNQAIARESLNGKLLSRVSYFRESSDGYITNAVTGNSKWASRTKDNANLSLRYRLAPKEILDLRVRYLRNDQGGNYVQGADPFRFEVREDVDYRAITVSRQLLLKHQKEISAAWRNDAQISYTASHQTSVSDADGSATNTAGTRYEDHADHFVSFENLLHFEENSFKNVLGFHAHNYRLGDVYDFNLLYPVGGSSTPIDVDQSVVKERTSIAVFDSASYDLAPNHTVQAGLRFERIQNRFGTGIAARRTQDLGGATNTAIDNYLASIDGDINDENALNVFLPKVGYLYRLGENSHVGATYTEGFRTGGLSINRRRATVVPYDHERTHNYELAYRYSDTKRSFDFNTFFVDWRDQQVQVSLSNDFFDKQIANAAKSMLWGAEMQLQQSFGQDRMSLGLGFVDTRFSEFNNNGRSYEGNRFPYAARVTGQASYQWRVIPEMSMTPVLRYVGESFTNAENTRVSPEQILFDLAADYVIGDFIVEAFVKNAFDRKYLVFDGRTDEAATTYQTAYNLTNTPRELGVRLSYIW